MYQKKLNSIGQLSCILRTTDGAFIPLADGNADYQEYLTWVAAGNVPENDPAFSVENFRAAKNAEINAARLAANSSSFTHAGHSFACDDLSRGDIDGTTNTILLTGQFPSPWPGYWKSVDNTLYPIESLEDWKLFYASMGAAGATNFAKSQSLKAQLAAATTIEQINAITWED